MNEALLHLDGAYGEGGGQIIRTALSLSAITGQPFEMAHIRVRRENPGLRAQHLTAVRAVAEICTAQVEGGEIGSRTLTFAPTTPPRAGTYHWDVGTAGAVSLILQTVLWPLALAEGQSTITLTGGTHVAWSPPIDYVREVYLPLLADLGLDARVEIARWGYYPHGGGSIQAEVRGPTRLHGLTLTGRGALRGVMVRSIVSNLPDHILQRQAEHADFLLRKQGVKPAVERQSPPSSGQGTTVWVLAEYHHARAGFTGYGRLRKPAEMVAEEACKAFAHYHKRQMPVDTHLADQLLLPLALAGAGSTSEYAVEEVTPHLLTNSWVIEQFLDVHIEIAGQEGQAGRVSVRV
ncbi:MAG: RNA 3'-terminal phosphate cyclase [Anaerolineae bacterium]|nr:RNA 3'-terminal phosphate cyclase [Anaerolineae bacterium]